MDNTTKTAAPATQGGNEDKELADLLADLGGGKSGSPVPGPMPAAAPAPVNNPVTTPRPAPVSASAPKPAPVAPAPAPAPTSAPAPVAPAPAPAPAPKPAPMQEKKVGGESELEIIKNKALDELRPLAERINLPPAEKFDTLLLIIRTTDDKDLIKYAHDIAKQIEDKDKQAQALLDIVREVDFFTHQ